MQLIFPSELVGHAATRLFSVGRVARIVEPDRFIRPHAVAATIVQHRFMPVMTATGVYERVLTFLPVLETLKQKGEAMPCVE